MESVFWSQSCGVSLVVSVLWCPSCRVSLVVSVDVQKGHCLTSLLYSEFTFAKSQRTSAYHMPGMNVSSEILLEAYKAHQ